MPRESLLTVKTKLLECQDTNRKLTEENVRVHHVNKAAVLRASQAEATASALRHTCDELRAALAECKEKTS